jgi:membrane peptidoglycan carboxypeptidase
MWTPDSAQASRRRYDLSDVTGSEVTPSPFGGAPVGLGQYLVTVVDQADAMATFAAGGLHAAAHLVTTVSQGGRTVYAAPGAAPERVLDAGAAADLTWALRQEPAARLPGNRPSAGKVGVWPLRDSPIETSHAWMVGYTGNLALAVWVGNVETELPLKDSNGVQVYGAGLPAQIYRTFMADASNRLALPVVSFPPPVFGGDVHAGTAG